MVPSYLNIENGSLDFITAVTDILQRELNMPITIHRSKKFNTYYIKIRQKIKELTAYLYKDATEDIYLTEKYDHIRNLLAQLQNTLCILDTLRIATTLPMRTAATIPQVYHGRSTIAVFWGISCVSE